MRKLRFTRARIALLAVVAAFIAPLAVIASATPASANAGGCTEFVQTNDTFYVCYSSDGAGNKTIHPSVNVTRGYISGHLYAIRQGYPYTAISGCSSGVATITGFNNSGPCQKPDTTSAYQTVWEGTGGVLYMSPAYTN
jgi:hypothetical protein